MKKITTYDDKEKNKEQHMNKEQSKAKYPNKKQG